MNAPPSVDELLIYSSLHLLKGCDGEATPPFLVFTLKVSKNMNDKFIYICFFFTCKTSYYVNGYCLRLSYGFSQVNIKKLDVIC